MRWFKKAEPLNPLLDYGNLNIMLAKQVAELESQLVDLNTELEEARKIINKIEDYGPSEPSEFACWFCDMGAAGYSSKGEKYHDDRCLMCEAQAYKKKWD